MTTETTPSTETTPTTETTPAESAPTESTLPTGDAAAEAAPEKPGDGPVVLPELEDDKAFDAWVDSLIDAEPWSEGAVVTARIAAIDDASVTVTLEGDKSVEIDKDEFLTAAGELEGAVGDEIAVYVESVIGDEVVLSKDKADKLGLWDALWQASKDHAPISGTVVGQTNGGFHVDVGVRAFLPGSQLDIRPIKAKQALGKTYDFEVIKFDRGRANIVLSRRTLLEKEREGLKEETLNSIRVGAIMNGIVRSIRDYGCFVDVGGIDGLLHITDMSWGRISHPKALVKVGEEITVQVLSFDTGTEKLKLGMKQITDDPWTTFDRKYQAGQRVTGKVVNLTDFGAFVEIEDGIEGLVHVSALSWTQRVKKPSDMLKKGQEVEAMILDIDSTARRISLGMKQLQPNPWQLVKDRLPVGSRITAKVRSVTNFGVFLGIEDGIDGLVHISDLTWNNSIKDPAKHYETGQEVEAVVLGIDVEAERASLGIKQLTDDPWHNIDDRYPIGRVVEGTVTKLLDFGAIVQVEPNIEGLVHISEVAEERIENLADVLEVGATVRAKVISLTADERKMGLSIARVAEAEAAAELAEQAAPTRTTIGDLIAEKIDISQLPTGKD